MYDAWTVQMNNTLKFTTSSRKSVMEVAGSGNQGFADQIWILPPD